MNNRWVGGTQHRKRRFTFGTGQGLELRFDGDLVIFETDGPTACVVRGGIDNSPQAKGRHPAAVLAGHGPLKYNTVTSSDGGPSVHMARYTLGEMCVLQGLPEDFCKEMPFTMEGKRQIIGNGVPIPLGRAVARAVRAAVNVP